ncbi:coiled-coil domain-containing protein 96 [Kryptolebias marmoratus]|uniref:Cilia and flagella associated protein 184 n=1 Tax=Kryptolebias marmoratus TaxID=37003 RepID=A0A3Q2ZNP0_KRYMA|nr:coiled-coil domain-containing protein 96 [Kryptolebias marmoratus]
MNSELELNERKKMTLINVHENEKEDDSAEISNEGELSASREVTEDLFVEEAATCESKESTGLRSVTTSEDLAMKMNNEQLLPHDPSVVFKADSSDGPLSLNVESPGPTRGEKKETPAAALDNKDANESMQEPHKERGRASQLNRLLQTKLTGLFKNRPIPDSQLEAERCEYEQQQQECDKYIHLLTDLKLQLSAASDSAQQQAEELRLQELEKLDEVEEEWQALVALKQDAAVSALSRRLGKEAARAKVQSVLTAEQLRQDELVKARLKHFKLRFRVRRLEAELREKDERSRDPLQVQFEQLQAERLEQKKQAERQSEESLKLQKKISSSLEILSNVKEKLFWSQMEVQAKRQQLTELEAMVARKKDLLTRTKQARNNLQRENLKLNERRGLLGNRVLLRDFEDTVDALDHLEKHLEDLKHQQAKIVFKCSRWKKKLETTLMNE